MSTPLRGKRIFLPIFPLPNVVLFPTVSLPLHIFEPRYRAMVRDAMLEQGVFLENHNAKLIPGVIGMALLRPGWEKDYEGSPAVYEVGCFGRMERVETLVDGKFNLTLYGERRFRLVSEVPTDAGSAAERLPYRVAEVEVLADDIHLVADENQKVAHVVSLVGRLTEISAHDPVDVRKRMASMSLESIVNSLSATLDLRVYEKQELLELPTLAARYERILAILRRELQSALVLGRAQDRVPEDPTRN